METLFVNLVVLLIGIALGSVISWLYLRGNHNVQGLPSDLGQENQNLKIELAETKAKFELGNARLKETESKLDVKEKEIKELSSSQAAAQKELQYLTEKYSTFKKEMESLHELSKLQFSKLANQVLEESKRNFVESNKDEMNHILSPLKSDINTFRKVIDDKKLEEAREFTSLKGEIQNLTELSIRLSDDAQSLANALKSDVKVQGNFGEDRLTLILENEGLQKYIDFKAQASHRDEENGVQRIPDVVLNLPGRRHLIIDSKQSLTAYTKYHNADTPEERKEYLRQHVQSVLSHIDELAEKNYQSLSGLNTPDFVFMFIPIDGALTLALQASPELLHRALKKKIVLVTSSTMVATLKIISLMWKKENQVNSVEEVFRQCNMLYDKFVLFLEEFDKIASSLDAASQAHKVARDRLLTGGKKGDTVIGRFERMKELGAKPNKNISESYVNQLDTTDEEETSLMQTE